MTSTLSTSPPNFGPQSVTLTIGVLFLAAGFSSILYGITCVQCLSYFRTWAKADMKWLRILIGSIWISNTIHLILNYHIAYHYCISAASDPVLYEEAVWSISVNALVIVLVTVQVYGFYIWRLWTLNRGHLNRILCIFLGILVITHFAIVMFACVKGFADKRLKSLQEYTSQSSVMMKAVQASSGLAASMELITVVALSWHLKKTSAEYTGTKSVINALIAYTVNTGLISSINLIFSFISVFIWPKTYMWNFFVLLIPPFGTNACLGALNGRNFFRRFQVGNGIGATSFAMSDLSVPRGIEVRADERTDNVAIKF